MAHQGVAVGVQPVGRDTDQHIAFLDLRRIYHLRAFDNTEHEPGHVEVVTREYARHLRGLAPDERTSHLLTGPRHTLHQCHYDFRPQSAHVDVVQEQ